MGANGAFGTCAGLVDDHHGALVWDGKCQWVTQFGWAKLQGGTNECRMEAYFLKMRMLDFEYRMVQYEGPVSVKPGERWHQAILPEDSDAIRCRLSVGETK